MSCFECGSIGSLHQHHVVPRSKGGTATVLLCEPCHSKVHGLNLLNHSELTRSALAAKKAKGEEVSGPTVSGEVAATIRTLRAEGASLRTIANHLNDENVPTVRGGVQWHISTVNSVIGYKEPKRRVRADQ